VTFCVVPPELEELQPRLRDYYAADPRVEVVVDRRFGERRTEPSPHVAERRATDGRRSSVPAAKHPALPVTLRRFRDDVSFQAAQDMGWRQRSMAAERQSESLAEALIATTEALRSRRWMSPRAFLRLSKAEAALERYHRWRAGA
jgi:hypothetical protein